MKSKQSRYAPSSSRSDAGGNRHVGGRLLPILLTGVIGVAVMILIIFLVGRMIGPLLAKDPADTVSPAGTASGTEEGQAPTLEVVTEPTYEEDYRVESHSYGAEFVILYNPNAVDPGYYFEKTDTTPAALSEELMERMTYTEERLGVDIVAVKGNGENFIRDLSMAQGAGDRNVYQLVLTNVDGAFYLMSGNLTLDLNAQEGPDLSAGYWYPELNENLQVAGAQRLAYNRFLMPDGYAIGFNRRNISQYMEESELYGLVTRGEWTLEALLSYSLLGAGKEGAEKPDHYGVNMEGWVTLNAMITASDIPMVESTPGSLDPVILYDTERLSGLEGLISRLLQEKTTSLLATPEPSLFDLTALSRMDSSYSGKQVERGLLPYPKLDREQEGYRTLYYGTYLAIPDDVTDPQMVFDVVETLAYASHDVRNAYMDAMIEGIRGDPVADRVMLQTIWDSLTVEPAYVLHGNYTAQVWNAMYYSYDAETSTVRMVEYLSRESVADAIERQLEMAYKQCKE